MKRILFLLSVVFLLTSVKYAFAEIPIYCPKCKELIYFYQKDELVKGAFLYAGDFKPANAKIEQPTEEDPMVCPICNADLNGWLFWGKRQGYREFRLAYNAISLLSKDEGGKWIWLPFDMPLLDMNNNICKSIDPQTDKFKESICQPDKCSE